MAIKKTPEQLLVINYLNKLELKAFKSNRQYWAHMDKRHEKDILNKLDKAMNDRFNGKGSDQSLYEIKNSSLKLSLDVSNFSADMYKSLFDWFAKRKGSAPKKILDLGCDNGIVTCFLGVLYPEAEVVGIDILPDAIKCANELSSKLDLTNVSFLEMDINNISNHFDENSFDLIVSLRSLHEVLAIQNLPRYWSTAELLAMDFTSEKSNVLMSLNQILLDETGEFITCERLAYMGALAQWSKMLTSNGFSINWEQADYLKFHELGEHQKMPLLVTNAKSIDLTDGELLEEIYKFELKDKVTQLYEGKVLKEPEAEIMFHQTQNKEFFKGLQVNYLDGSGNMRLEIWKTPEYLLQYQYTNIGYRELRIVAQDLLETSSVELNTIKTQLSRSGKTLLYTSIEKRDEFDKA